ncbi:hypothetical protein TNCV_2149151 [Trichonephila clavipes]|nr:hypothetical protein TNCV_2149151 [Trichonephila clavipes]
MKQISTLQNCTRSLEIKRRNKFHTHPFWVTEEWFMIRWIKQNLFADTMEESFQENSEPYNDEFIEKVERKVRRYFSKHLLQHPAAHLPRGSLQHHTGPRKQKSRRSGSDQKHSLEIPPNQCNNLLTKIFNKCLMYGYFPDA